ncbi:hypothetical protein FQ087_15190 [Sporosarcina sp. ANT_H38]|uniref:hypothetical protein n=1 Tax=Sporosarcina sp. ANT_H38 TaxID=2597358 RepID=UPI0011F39DA4|nr:hypothetical protein [Sporosarcina sp. ANT_H38]KAA0955919.1 hypothetical protein FQ087_15190 [Sporosarcina sp. ANT_H38]
MKEKLAIMLITFTLLFVYLLTPAAKASSEISIGGKAGSYQYKVIMGQGPFTWEIGHKGSLFVIEESEINRDDLNTFRNSVEDIKIQKFKVGFSVFYLFVIGMVLVIAKRRKNGIGKEYLLIIIGLVGITFYYGLIASIGLNHSLRDAEFYYLGLIQ